ncbi:MAG: GYD domain-containing protein [Azospirillaceae bacterium]
MPIWITQGSFTSDTLKSFVAKPEDRRAAIADLMAASGARLIDYYVTFGEYDFLIIAEGEKPVDVLAALLTAGASGTVSSLRTTMAVSTAEAKQAMEKAQTVAKSFRPAGG